jgi:hypothetical protein
MTEEQKPLRIDFTDNQDVLRHMLNLLNELQEHYTDADIAGLLSLSLMSHLADCEDRDLFNQTHRYLDEALTALWYEIPNPDNKTITSPLASKHFH